MIIISEDFGEYNNKNNHRQKGDSETGEQGHVEFCSAGRPLSLAVVEEHLLRPKPLD